MTKSQKIQKEKLNLCENQLFLLKEEEKKGCKGGDSRQKVSQNHPSMMNKENLETKKILKNYGRREERKWKEEIFFI
jgi:hypothetical protein